MKKLMENWKKVFTQSSDSIAIKSQKVDDITETVSEMLDKYWEDNFVSDDFDEVGEEGTKEKVLFEAYGNSYKAINSLSKALKDSIIASEKE